MRLIVDVDLTWRRDMEDNLLTTVSGRVSPRTRRLAETAADLQNSTLSAFVADAVEHAALRELRSAATEPEPGTTVTPQRIEAM